MSETRRRGFGWLAVVAGVAAVGLGCSRGAEPKPGAAAGGAAAGVGAVVVNTNSAPKLIAEMAPEDVIVAVNGVGLTRREFDAMLDNLEKGFLSGRPGSSQRDAAMYRQRRARTLPNEFLTKQLLLQEAARLNLKPAPERLAEVRGLAEETARRQGKSLEELLRAAPDGGAAMRRGIEEQALILTLRDAQFGDRLRVPDERVKATLDAIRKQNEAVAATNALFQAQAAVLLKQLREGADFAALADRHSLAGDAAGGEWGEYEYTAFDDRKVRHAASMLPVGAVSDVLETEEGWMILKIVARKESTDTEPGTVTLARILLPKAELAIIPPEAEIRRQLESRRLAEVQGPWLDGIKARSALAFPNGTNWWPQATRGSGLRR